ncbi:MAG: hypothetical protein ACI4XG_23195 [Bradyrhizobium sp.]
MLRVPIKSVTRCTPVRAIVTCEIRINDTESLYRFALMLDWMAMTLSFP